MFSELERVMAFATDENRYAEALGQNVVGKKSSAGASKSARYLKRLYGFDLKDSLFLAFRFFWNLVEPQERPMVAMVYALHRDDLLAESHEVIEKLKVGTAATASLFEDLIESHHPHLFAANTRQSISRNLASSWKQAGFVAGKVKTMRVQPEISYRVACFAFLLAYLQGDRGEFIWKNKGVAALGLPESKLRELAMECARRDLMQYQFAGSVTAISFQTLLNKIGIDGDTH